MTKDDIRAVVNQVACTVDGTRYQFRVQWLAVEKYCDPALARQLLRLEVVAVDESGHARAPLSLFVWVSNVSELPSILEDALHHRLAEGLFSHEAVHRPEHRVGAANAVQAVLPFS